MQRDSVRIGVPYRGQYEVLLNSDAKEFGGKWTNEKEVFTTEEIEFNNQPHSIEVTIPALSVMYIRPKRVYGVKK